jgi:hypothetical protein
VAGDQDIDVPGNLTQPVECRLVGAHLIGAARVEERDQDVGEHVAHPLRPLSGFTGSLGAGGGGVARHVAEPGMPEQVVPVGMGGTASSKSREPLVTCTFVVPPKRVRRAA